MARPLAILTVSASDSIGGAQRVGWLLFKGFQARGHHSWLAVGTKASDDPNVFEIRKSTSTSLWTLPLRNLAALLATRAKKRGRLARLHTPLVTVGQGRRAIETALGLESYHYPESRRIFDLTPERPDIVHCHNLHGDYFDLFFLPQLTARTPTVLTMHDAWLLSGHCSYSRDCPRWETGCGKCPDLTVPVSVPHDLTALNWKRKKKIFARSNLYLASPSRWLLSRAERSILKPAIREARVIPYGVDLELFQPGDKLAARRELGLAPDTPIVLASAVWIRNNPFKDYKTIEAAIHVLAGRYPERPLLFLALGQRGHSQWFGHTEIRFGGLETDSARLARYYQAADVFVHAAHADNFPNTILEAMACGTPVVATAVGGIPEQVCDGVTGYLVSHADAEAMAARVQDLLTDPERAEKFGRAAAETARREYDLERQLDDYLNWYAEILDRHANR